MQFRFRCAAVLTAVLLCSAAALPALAEETATPETADSVVSASTYTGWKTVNGKDYWYENGVKQGTTGRGKEIYDPDSDAWYWLDAKQGGAKAVNKDVYQESNGGKWVRYDANGHMIKGWDTNDEGTYYFDLITGAMAKGDIVVDNLPCSFDTTTGIGCNLMWHSVDGKDYWYEAGKRQGYDPNNAAYRGKEIYDPASGAWYWLDNVQQGAKAVSKDVYQESNGGKWVRYDANGQMIKGWNTNENGTYYFDPITGAMAKGDVEIDGVPCSFDETTGIGLNLAWKQENGKDYWYENGLVDKRWAALNAGDIDQFLVLTRESGASSAMYLQNVVAKLGSEQPSMYALALAEHVLDGRGAVRIHGGGFGGTIQAFVPLDLVDPFITKMNGWLGKGSARHYAISDKGAYAAWL